MTAELQQNRYDQLIRRVGGIIGPGSKVAEALGELFPVIDVENCPGELLRLGGTILGFGGAAATGLAGQRGRVQLFNPIGSGKIVTCTSVILSTINTGTVRGIVTGTENTLQVNNDRRRDTRDGVASRTTAQIRTDSVAGVVADQILFQMLTNTPYHFLPPDGFAVLAPGTGLLFEHNSLTATITANFFWRERPAEASELSFSG